jgi:hypothetical protein
MYHRRLRHRAKRLANFMGTPPRNDKRPHPVGTGLGNSYPVYFKGRLQPSGTSTVRNIKA